MLQRRSFLEQLSDSSPNDRQRIYDEFKRNNRGESPKKTADQSGDMIRALKLQDTWTRNFILDCGASYTVRSKQIVRALKPAGCSDVKVQSISPAIEFELAVKSLRVIADATAKLDLEIELDAGPVVLRLVTCYPFDENTGTVMIGRDVLKALCIDALTMLKHMRSSGKVKECVFRYKTTRLPKWKSTWRMTMKIRLLMRRLK
jgi:hypothetical protein